MAGGVVRCWMRAHDWCLFFSGKNVFEEKNLGLGAGTGRYMFRETLEPGC